MTICAHQTYVCAVGRHEECDGQDHEGKCACFCHQTMIASLCGPDRCEHVFDGPEVPVSDNPAHPGGLTTTCSKCGARAIDVCYWL